MSENSPLFRLKAELQGNGLIAAVRKRVLPNSQEMSRFAQQEFQASGASLDDVDGALDALLDLEYKRYRELESSVVARFWQEASSLTADGKYPEFSSALDAFRSKVREVDDPAHALDSVSGIYGLLIASNNQSAKSRSGSSLMHHIAFLLDAAGFKQGQEFLREVQLDAGSGCKLDFFFPSLEQFRKEPRDCCAVACQTTSNDRFRLTFAQMPDNTRNRACTAIGSRNFGKALGPNSLTSQKLAEATSENVKFVVLGHAIDDRLRGSGAVMSYAEWFEELHRLRSFW